MSYQRFKKGTFSRKIRFYFLIQLCLLFNYPYVVPIFYLPGRKYVQTNKKFKYLTYLTEKQHLVLYNTLRNYSPMTMTLNNAASATEHSRRWNEHFLKHF